MIRAAIGDRKIQVTVVVKISAYHFPGVIANRENLCRLKGPVTIAKKNSDTIILFIDHDQI